MSTFKIKSNKTKLHSHTTTLDETHRTYMNQFVKKQKVLPIKKNRLDQLKRSLKTIELIPAINLTPETMRQRTQIKNEISKIEDQIYDIENNISEMEYYSKTEDIIMDYYDIIVFHYPCQDGLVSAWIADYYHRKLNYKIDLYPYQHNDILDLDRLTNKRVLFSDITPKIEILDKLEKLAKADERSKSYFIKKAVKQYLENLNNS